MDGRGLESMQINLNLQFFNAESEGKTEKATPKKRSDARKKGQVAKSAELNTAVILLVFFIGLQALGSYYLTEMDRLLISGYSQLPSILAEETTTGLVKQLGEAVKAILLISAPLWLCLFVGAFVVAIAQVGYHPTFSPLAPKMSKMNPLSGLKRMVSKDMIMELLKGLGKIAILGSVFLSEIEKALPIFMTFHEQTMRQILINIGTILVDIGISIGGAFLVIAILDYAYQKYKFEDSIKMSKQEVKDEYKQAEGDPQIKGKIRQKMREMSMKRMMQAIPEADVIITNPTHFAVVIAYDSKKHAAPMVVAKGVDYVAQKIKEKGKEHKIHIVENKPLARMLYYTVEIDRPIPEELYHAVAEVLAFVYNLDENKRR